MIFKVQRALFPPDGPVLIYNQDHTYEGTVALSQEEQDLFFGSSLKVYVEGNLDAAGCLTATRIVEDQPW